MWKNKSSLTTKILGAFLLFSVLILGFLWAFQVLFLDSFYKNEKTYDIQQVGNYIKTIQNKDNFDELIENVSFDKEVCIEITDSDNQLYVTNFFGKGCMMDGEKKLSYLKDFITSDVKEKTYSIHNPRFNNETLLYAIKLDQNRYAFINTSLQPIDSTAYILRKQLVLVTIVVLCLSFIISYFISNYLSKPIVDISRQASRLAEGDFKGEFKSNSNISEIQELSDTLNYAREELGKTDELRRDLVANVSHDLKTPLTMIKAYAEMAMDLHRKKPQKQKEDLEIIVSETDRLSLLVGDILDLSKMESSIEELNIEEFDLVLLVDEILKRYQMYQELENYHFIFNHKDSSVLIHADKKKMEQVIYNLINNAINYTGEDNTVTISILQKDLIRVEVSDTGKGIKEEDIPYIWDRYYKNKKKHKRNLIGTGLGLSIVKSILEAHHYTYGVNSKIDHGSTFYFEIKKED